MGLYNQSLNENIDNLQVNNKVGSGSGSSTWEDLQGKPFETIGDGLSVFNKQLVAHGYHDYSEDEQIVGTWFGQALYEKTVDINLSGSPHSWINTNISSNGYKFIKGFAFTEAGVYPIAVENDISTNTLIFMYFRNGANLTFNKLTIQYTKD